MTSPKLRSLDLADVKKEIETLDSQIAQLEKLRQRRNDLATLWGLAQRVMGFEDSQSVAAQDEPKNSTHPRETVAAMAYRLLAEKGDMSIGELLVAMREAGWKGSGQDPVDKRRIYSAIHLKSEFKLEDGKWEALLQK